MPTLTPSIWFDKDAEAAAGFYVSIFPNSRVVNVLTAPADSPGGKKGEVLAVDWELDGQPYNGINGGPEFKPDEAISFVIDCADQAEVDRYWTALTADGGEPGPCGWLKDQFGISWQVVPRRLNELLASSDADAAERAMEAMLQMGKLDVAALERAYAGN